MSFNYYVVVKRLILVIVFGLFIAAQGALAAGSGTLKGKVYDSDTHEELPGASILIQGTSIGASTDINGAYSIPNAPSGEETIIVSYVGYVALTTQVTIGEGQNVVKDFYLTPQAVTTKNVVVTAQARGEMQSINQELSSTQLVNVVSAEKMKELPDANIAESIGRLPGISLQRDAGEADAVIIRGLAPKYNEITIEGVPMSSTYYGDRGVDLSLLGDDLVKGVEVSKTLMPNMDADALGGTVNLTLKTADPGFHYNVWGNGGYNNLRDSYGNYKFALSGGDRILNNKVGILVQGNIEEKQLPSDNFSAGYAGPTKSSVILNPPTFYINTNSATVTDNNTQRHRYGASVILDYASDFVDVKLFNVYDQKNDSSITRQNLSSFSSTQFQDQIFLNDTKTEQETHSLQLLIKPGAGMEVPISVSWTKGDQKEPNQKEFDFYQTAVATTPKGSSLIYGQPLTLIQSMGVLSPTNPNSTLYSIVNTSSALVDNSYDAKIDWKVPFKISEDFSGVLSAGGKYHAVYRGSSSTSDYVYMLYGDGATNRRIIDTEFVGLFPGLANIPVNSVSNLQAGLYAYPFVDNGYGRSSVLGYPVGPSWEIYELSNMSNILFNQKSITLWQNGPSNYDLNYTDHEQTNAGYVMGEFNIGSNLTIVPGARYQEEKTDISAYRVKLNSSNANGLDGDPPTLLDSKRDNPNWYPSVNIKYKVTDNIQVLGAAYKSESLPDYSEITPLTDLGDGGTLTLGNPLLKPATAWNYDIGTSVYSNEIGLFTVDLFYKDISNLIYGMSGFYPFRPFPVTGAPSNLASLLPARSFYDTTWINGSASRLKLSASIPMNDPYDAYLRGIEFSWQTHFWYLPGLLSGIVLDFNLTLMTSNQMYPYFQPLTTPFGSIDTLKFTAVEGALQDQPKAIYNAILGWDYKGFSSRFSARYQQLTLQSIDTQYPGGLRDSYYDNVLLIDISLKQQIIGNLSIFANATNVNSHVDNYYYSHPTYAPPGVTYAAGQLPTSEQTYGWDLQFGLTFYY